MKAIFSKNKNRRIYKSYLRHPSKNFAVFVPFDLSLGFIIICIKSKEKTIKMSEELIYIP